MGLTRRATPSVGPRRAKWTLATAPWDGKWSRANRIDAAEAFPALTTSLATTVCEAMPQGFGGVDDAGVGLVGDEGGEVGHLHAAFSR
ncbi:hypothetical protein [Streptomyces zagrosensis]|uniref:Uncharacterized protein n=1 Tax=Streptomyces zagrosensis TaxID=1042984 RepID=A0A7W9QA54_9ACTN|nr:hypothetical protein [Streptomyces zagrosensis]MBB5936379.1 hypothetical protein [Streptomyces zagrosensis]